MSKMFALGIALTAKDMFSPAFSSLGDAIRNSTKDLKNFGTATAAIGTGLKGASMALESSALSVIKSYSDLEEAQTQLENTLMKSDGSVSPLFKAISDEAIKLGNALPGTTADFYKMASTLKSLGVTEESIVGGALKSSAYLKTVIKGISYEDAAESTAKFKEALGIADEDLISFIDDIQRLSFTGVKVGEMSFAFSKIGATMKGLGMSGLQASRDISPLIGMLIKSGFSGETVGTNLGNMIESAISFKGNKKLDALGIDLQFTDTSGKFLGFENMIKEMEKLKAIESDVERINIMEAIFGKGEAASMAAIFVEKGVRGLSEYKKKLSEQADLMKRVENSTGTLANMWEALTGTFTNVTALIGGALAPELKGLTAWLGDLTVSIGAFLEEHPFVTRFLAGALFGFVALAGGLGTAAIAVSMFTTVLGVLGVTSMVTFGWIIAAIVAVGAIIFAVASNWDGIVAGMGAAWNWFTDIVGGFRTAVYAQFEPLFNWISKAFTWAFQSFNVADIFSWIAQSVVNTFSALFSWLGSQITGAIEEFNTFASFITELFTDPVTTITGLFDSFFNWIGGKFQWVLDSVNGVKQFFGAETNVQQQTVVASNPQAIPIMARAGNIPAQGSTSNSVSVTIQNPNFNSPEEASRTQAQIDEQVRKALREIQRDQADRSFND